MCFKMCAKRRRLFNLGLFLQLTLTFLLCVPGVPGFDISSMLSSQKQSISGKLPLPDLKSLVSPETLQKVLQAKALGIPVVSAEVSLPDSKALNELLAKLKPKEGRFDPALMEKIHSSLESINPNRHSPMDAFHRFSHSVDDKTMSNLPTAPTSPATTLVLPKRKRGKSKKNKFSAKFRLNETMVVENPNLVKYNLSSDSQTPFSYITDPNLRNHRLYDWEFETYKNFTHIDQAEDLFADESHPSEEVRGASMTKTGHSDHLSRTPAAGSGWVPKARDRIPPRPRRPPLDPKQPLPASYEEFNEPTTSHSNIHEHAVISPGVFVRFTPDMENSEPNKRPGPGLRAPLRVSSMENQVYRNPQHAERRPFYEENNSRPSSENFRPSQPEIRPELSAPVFVDPDQDFFTSTIRHQKGNRDKSLEAGNYEMPPFPQSNRNRQQKDRESTRHRDRLNYNKNSEHNSKRTKFYSDEYDENSSRLSTKHKSDRILGQQSSDDRDKDRKRLEQHIKKQNYDTNYMSEYLGHTPSSAASDPAMYFDHPDSELHNGNNEYSGHQNQQQQQSGGVFGLGLDQLEPEQPRPLLADHIYAAGQHHLYHHPYGSHSHQVQHYIEDEGGSWYNTFFILGGLVALSALIAFFLPSLLHVSSVGKDVDKIGDVNSDVDLWTEIKGVYKDLVHIVKGDYAYFNNKRYGNNVNLTYRNEDDSETTTAQGDTIEIPRASRRHDKSATSSYNNSSLAYHFSSTPANTTPSILNSSADSFLGEWAKVQLINN